MQLKTISLVVVVMSLVLAGSVSAQTNNPQSSPDRTQTADRPTSTENNANADSRQAMEVPEGTEIVVRTNEAIDSTTAQEGQSFSGIVQEAVTDPNGQTLIPKDADARLTIRKVNSGGTTGTREMVMALDSINIRGHHYRVNSADVSRSGNSGIGKNRRTGEYVGGGAVLGTLLGAIAGGGKGAAIGAVAGAAAGGTAQVLTRGKQIKIPAESSLRFKLDQPLSLRATD